MGKLADALGEGGGVLGWGIDMRICGSTRTGDDFDPACGLVLSLLAGACAQVNYADLPAGRFDGRMIVIWVGGGSETKGDGKFLNVPDPRAPLTFTRKDGAVISPGPMYTDRGSIPKRFQAFKGLSPGAPGRPM